MKLSMNFVIVNYNNSKCTLDLIKSLEKQHNADFVCEIIVVDNSSNDSECDILKDIKSVLNVSVIYLNENIGYFHGLNHGLKFLKNKGIPTFIGNNDLLFNEDFCSIFFDSEYDEKILAISPSFKTKDDVYQNPAQPSKPKLLKRFFYSIYFSNYYIGMLIYKIWNKIGLSAQSKFDKDFDSRVIYLGMGAGYILQPSFFKIYEKLIYPHFLYGEEAFFSKQIEDANGDLYYDSDLEILHLESVATSKLPSIDKYNLMKKSYLVYKEYFRV